MATILAISSLVAHGTVGLSIITPALQALGHTVIGLPTVVLSNHPGHAHVAGTRIEPAVLMAMLDALAANGWLEGVEGIVTGYLPSPAHVAFARAAVLRVRDARRGRALTYLCDPVLGDDPKGLYIDEAAAYALRDELIAISDLATPNRFELSFLSGPRQGSLDSPLSAARHRLVGPVTFATSIPCQGRPHETCNVLADTDGARVTRVPLRPEAPNGTGDLFSALVLAAWIARQEADRAAFALAFATAGVDGALERSTDRNRLEVSAFPLVLGGLTPWLVEAIDTG